MLSRIWELISRRADTLIALSSMAVATVALTIGISEMRKDNALEMLRWKPHLEWGVAKNKKDGFTVQLRNNGLGPAEVKWLQVFWKDTQMSDWEKIYLEVYKEKGEEEDLPMDIDQTFSFPYPGNIIPTDGDRSNVVLISERQSNWKEALWKRTASLSFAVCYCSLLGQCEVEGWTKRSEELVSSLKKKNITCLPQVKYPVFFTVHDSFMK